MAGGSLEMRDTVSIVSSQPLPFGPLEREKHIEMIFETLKSHSEPTCECPTGAKLHQVTPDHKTQERQNLPRKMEKGWVWPSDELEVQVVEEQKLEDAAGLNFLSVLETVGEIHITAEPQLQGPQCVSRRNYRITTEGGRSHLFVAVEESSCACLQCCGPARACSLQGFDSQGHQIFFFERPFRVDACCFGSCLMEIKAYSPEKNLIGTVCQKWSMFTPLLEVRDSEGSSTIRIQGSCCPCRCLSNQQFQIISNVGEEIGKIWKKWPGFYNDSNMNHDFFGLDVTLSLDSHNKLLLLAATFLLNYMFFELS